MVTIVNNSKACFELAGDFKVIVHLRGTAAISFTKQKRLQTQPFSL